MDAARILSKFFKNGPSLSFVDEVFLLLVLFSERAPDILDEFFSCPLVHSWKLFHCQRLVRLFWECGLRHYGRRKETFQRRYVHHGRLEFFLSLIAGPFSFPTLQFSFSNAWTDKLGTEFEFELPS